MDLNKFTERARGFVQAAQTIALRENHQRLSPEHILKALMDDDQGLASNLIQRSGGAPARVVEALETAIAKIPQVTGDAQGVFTVRAHAQRQRFQAAQRQETIEWAQDAAGRVLEEAHLLGEGTVIHHRHATYHVRMTIEKLRG